jgi:hypothetical protein
MKTRNIILLLSFSFLTAVTTLSQVPVIISQSTIIDACEGDSVTLKVSTDKAYDFQWYTALKEGTGFNSYTALAGEKAYALTLNPVSASLNPYNLYYFLRIISPTDTLWSAEIKVQVRVLSKVIEDTILTQRLPALIRIHLEVYMPLGNDIIWSTGDTIHITSATNYAEFWHLGKSWVTYKREGCSRTDTFQVVIGPPILHINTDKNTLQYWCADTVYIEKDVNMQAGVIIFPRTTVKFKGNFRLQSKYIDAYGIKEDSIYILGNTDTLSHSNQGYLQTYSTSYEAHMNSFNNLVIKNMHYVDLFNSRHTVFSYNDRLSLLEVNDCIIRHNKRLELNYSIQNSIVYDNDTIFGIASFGRSYSAIFKCNHNIFKSNKTGLITGGGPFSFSHISNNIFDSNESTAITIVNLTFNYIDQNIFKFNTSHNGPSVLKGNFSRLAPPYVDFSDYCFAFRNNTMFNNDGQNCIGIYNKDTSTISGIILNNIFWNKSTDINLDIEVPNLGIREFNITNNSFRGDETGMALPEDNNFRIADNLFNTYPDFSDTLNSVLTLKESSPLIDKGTDIKRSFIADEPYTTDFIENPRKIGDSVDIGAYEYYSKAPPEFSYITPDTFVCAGNSVSLKAFPKKVSEYDLFKFDWYRNGELVYSGLLDSLYFSSFNVRYAGHYTVALSNSMDTLWSNPIFVDYETFPFFIDGDLQKKDVCTVTGVELHARTESHYAPVFNWYDSHNGQLPSTSDTCYINPVEKNYTLHVTATNLCASRSATIELIVIPLPAPRLGNDIYIDPADSILLDPKLRQMSYLWSTGEQGKQIYAHAGDTVWLKVTDWFYCTGIDTIIIFANPVTSVPSANNNISFLIYPNPAKDKLFLKVADNITLPYRISIVSQYGKSIYEKEVSSREEQVIDVAAFGKGIYLIQIQSAAASGTGKFVVL